MDHAVLLAQHGAWVSRVAVIEGCRYGARQREMWGLVLGEFATRELRELAARASTIDERLSGGFVAVPTSDEADRIARRIEAWRVSASGGDTVLFRRRLERDGIDLDAFSPLLGEVAFAPETQTPAWVETFAWVFAAMAGAGQQEAARGTVDPDDPIPFEELFVPVAAAASTRLDGPLGDDRAIVTEQAKGALQRALVRRLSELCAPSLFDGFVLARAVSNAGGFWPDLPDPAAASRRDRYDRYLDDLRAGELRDFFVDRPVLARLVSTVTAQWIDAAGGLLRRLKKDREAICEMFHGGRDIGPLVDLEWSLSDPHNGGQTVCRLTFENDLTIGYKPKDLEIDVAWMRLLAWLEARGAPASARAPRALAMQGYGWVEWLEPASCANTDEANDYFRRAGAMLCLFHLLRGSDFHLQNVLATAGAPAAIDLETLYHPLFTQFLERGTRDSADAVAHQRLSRSVLSTGFLPYWRVLPGGRVAAVGGLNVIGENSRGQIALRNINSDGMVYERPESSDAAPASHLPSLDGRMLSASEYADGLTGGFEAMYRFVIDHRDDLLAPQGPIHGFDGRRIRAVLRATLLYVSILQLGLRRQCLSNGVDWSQNFDFLSRLSGQANDDDLLTRIQSVERRALAQLDVPYFTAQTDGTALVAGDGSRFENVLTETGTDAVRSQLEAMTEATLSQEVEFIRLALEAGERTRDLVTAEPWQADVDDKSTATVGLSRDDAVTWASEIATALDKEAIHHRDGAAWIGALPLLGEEYSQLEVISHDLYGGTAGVALFLAALYRITQEPYHRDLALRALAPLREQLRDHEHAARLARTMGLGGGAGLGGLTYVLVKAAGFLDDDTLMDDAGHCADLITPQAIAQDHRLDVLVGVAGAVLSLLALYRARPDEQYLAKAIACGERLLASQIDCDAGGRAWKTIDENVLAGFSHGSAGIAYALLRLHSVAGGDALRAAAQDAVAYETAVFSPDHRNWPDSRSHRGDGQGPRYLCQWCHGATGIGMGRLGGLDVLGGAGIMDDIETAISQTADNARGFDHLCCGNFGRLEFLFTAGQRLGRDDLTALALQRAHEVVAHAKEAGSFRWVAGDDHHNPGFFTGLSGAGYTLLRFTHPDVLPSVLLWE